MSDEPTVCLYPWEKDVTVEDGTTILEAANDVGVSVESLCGGQGLCGTCKVIVEEGQSCVSEPTEADEMLLSEEQLANGYRLSCRAKIDGSGGCETVDVTVPSVSQNTGGIVLTEGNELEFELDPAVTKYHLELETPTLENNLADLERVTAALEDGYDVSVTDIDHLVHRELPTDLRDGTDDDSLEITATVYDSEEIIDIQSGWQESMYGMAVDIGTTTVAAYLIDLRTGDRVAIASQINPQSKFGGDLMTRIRYTRRNEDGREELQAAILDGINDLVDELITEAGIDRSAIYESVFVGNTAMHHLFLGIQPSHVAGSPYVAANHGPVAVKARDLGIEINEAGYLYWLPISGGWVGPDKVSVLLVSGHYNEDEMTVCIDIGTNGEISVGNDEKMWVTSAPAGPALEGAEITHGVRAQEGAIESVTIDPNTFDPTLDVIGDATPSGLCGSAVIDTLAQLFEVGIIDQRGQFHEELLDHPRLRRNDEGVVEFVIVWDDDSAIDGDVVVTQNDLREIQQAKAAIQAGTRVLMQELDIETVDRVVLAGGFGNYIDPESAMTTGLYPDVEFEKVESIGNAAGIGAQLALLNLDRRHEAQAILDEVEYYEIAGTDIFRDNFMHSMYVPHRDFEVYPRVKARIEAKRDLDTVPTPET